MSYHSPSDQDRLAIFLAAELARRLLARGLKLNAPEAIALIADEMHLAARAGQPYEQVVALGRRVLTGAQVLDGVAELVPQLRVEVLFDEGTRLIILDDPIGEA